MAVALYLATYFPLNIDQDRQIIDEFSQQYPDFDKFARNFYEGDDMVDYTKYKSD